MRVYLHTFGCKTNQYDTERVRQAVEDAGATVATDPRDADAAVINTCTVTHVSESKLRSFVRRVSRVNPRVRTVLMGCAAALDDGTLLALPNVTAVVSGADPARVLSKLGMAVPTPARGLRSFRYGRRAWLKIQDGCDEHCTFCATRLARGRNRSRPIDEIVAEAAALAAEHAEIVLTGVHIGTYGLDRDSTLGQLVEILIERIPGTRFRLSSVEATELCDRLIALMRDAPERLAPHLHAPLQSGSDRVLRRMGRHWYTSETYRSRVEELATQTQVLGLGADVIVGFPGETDDDHRRTVELIRGLPFTYLHVFPYSPRPDAVSHRLGTAPPGPTVAARSRELRALVDEQGARYRQSRAGSTADVVTIRARGGYAEGITGDYLTVLIPSVADLPPRVSARLRVDDSGLLVGAPEKVAA